MLGVLFRLISYIASAIFLYNSTVYIFLNFGFGWTLVAYFIFFIAFFFFPIWAYFFFGYFDLTTNIAWLISVIHALYQVGNKNKSEKNQFDSSQKEFDDAFYKIQDEDVETIFIFPFAKDVSEVYDFSEDEPVDEDSGKKFIYLQIGIKNKEVINKNYFSPELDSTLVDDHQRYLFHKAIQSWLDQIVSKEFRIGEDLPLLKRHQFVTGDKFVVGNKDSDFYIAGDNSEEE